MIRISGIGIEKKAKIDALDVQILIRKDECSGKKAQAKKICLLSADVLVFMRCVMHRLHFFIFLEGLK